MGVVSKDCIVCDKRVSLRLLKDHMASHKMDLDNLKFSSDPKEYVKTICLICGKDIMLTTMRGHVKTKHNIQIQEYKTKYLQGKPFILIDKVLHQCNLCEEILLLDSDAVASHLGKHKNVTHKDYNAKYMKGKGYVMGPNGKKENAPVIENTNKDESNVHVDIPEQDKDKMNILLNIQETNNSDVKKSFENDQAEEYSEKSNTNIDINIDNDDMEDNNELKTEIKNMSKLNKYIDKENNLFLKFFQNTPVCMECIGKEEFSNCYSLFEQLLHMRTHHMESIKLARHRQGNY